MLTMIQPGAIASKFGENGVVLGFNEPGPYQELLMGIEKVTSEALKPGTFGTWRPEKVAQITYKASTTKTPKARYRPGFVAKALIYLRLWLPYRMWDKMFINNLTKQGKKLLNNN